ASTEAAPGRSDVAVPPAVPAPDLSYRSTLSRRPLPISSRVLASVAERVTTGKVCGGCLNPPIGAVSHSDEDPAVHVAQRSELNAEAWRLYMLRRKDRGALALDVTRGGTSSFKADRHLRAETVPLD
ncbi:MAG TPA: hypothetical protein VL069_00650, partial [Opitutus sp.]|nr:hypothetical protein [Opitutus sp.]